MYKLLKIHDDKFKMISMDGPSLIEGSWPIVKGFCEYQGFNDLDLALEVMDKNGHNAAEFGINRSFIFSMDNPFMPKLKIVS